MPAENGSRINPGKIAAEMVGIVFAVLLALWLEGLREDAEMQDLADELTARIDNEIRTNRAELIEAMDDNNRLLALLSEALQADEINPDIFSSNIAFTAGNTSDANWQTAKMTSAATLMPLDRITAYSDLYETQDYYRIYNQAFMQNVAVLFVQFTDETIRRSALQVFTTHVAISNTLGDQLRVKYDAYLGIEAEAGDTP